MSTRYELLERKCRWCGAQIQRVSMKNPFIDDYADECSNPKCSDYGDGLKRLESWARAQAKREDES